MDFTADQVKRLRAPTTAPSLEAVSTEHPDRYLGVGIAITRLGVHIARTFSERLEPLGLTASHAAVLRVLGHFHEATQQELAGKLGFSAYRVSELVGSLQAAELVELSDPEHTHHVHLTQKGSDLYQEVVQCARAYEGEILADLSDEEAATLQNLLHRIEKSIGLEHKDGTVSTETLAATLAL